MRLALLFVQHPELVLQSADYPNHLLGQAFDLESAELAGHRDPVLEHLEEGAELGSEAERHILSILAFETVAAHLHIFNNPALYDEFDGTTFYLQKIMNVLFMRTKEGEKCHKSSLSEAIGYVIDFSSETYEDLIYQYCGDGFLGKHRGRSCGKVRCRDR